MEKRNENKNGLVFWGNDKMIWKIGDTYMETDNISFDEDSILGKICTVLLIIAFLVFVAIWVYAAYVYNP